MDKIYYKIIFQIRTITTIMDTIFKIRTITTRLQTSPSYLSFVSDKTIILVIKLFSLPIKSFFQHSNIKYAHRLFSSFPAATGTHGSCVVGSHTHPPVVAWTHCGKYQYLKHLGVGSTIFYIPCSSRNNIHYCTLNNPNYDMTRHNTTQHDKTIPTIPKRYKTTTRQNEIGRTGI